MTARIPTATVAVAFLLLLVAQTAPGQRTEVRRIAAAVSYVSANSIYVSAGRGSGLAVGDTLEVRRGPRTLGRIAIAAVSSSSSSAQAVDGSATISVGDSTFTTKEVAVEEAPVRPEVSAGFSPLPGRTTRSESNLVTGRFALQYISAGATGSPLDFSQPGAVLRINVARLFGTGLTLTLHGRSSYELAAKPTRFAPPSQFSLRLYEMSLSYDNPAAWYGYSLGRIVSRYVGGLGVFDGGQAFARAGGLTVGAAAGTQANYKTSAFDPDNQKLAGFVNYSWGGDIFSASDVTLAYCQNLFQGRLDRDFLYLQTSLRFSRSLFLYQSTEVDFHRIDNGLRSSQFRFTNGFVTVTYLPTDWLTLNGGYDAQRSIYLFESMKSISDTLLDRSLREGYRASASILLPLNVVLTTTANLRLASGTTPSARTLSGGLRMGDILGTGVNLGGQYASIRGLYTEGNDVSIDIDRWFWNSFTAMLRLDSYVYRAGGRPDQFRTLTASANLSYRISRSLYALLNLDQVWDTLQDSRRVYLEMGVHF